MAHAHPYDMLIAASFLGIGIGLAFAALGNLIMQAVPPEQTGAAAGMNTVMRTVGGAIGGQLAAIFIAGHTAATGLPTVTGFTVTFVMSTAFLIVCTLAALLVPEDAHGAPDRPSSSLPPRSRTAEPALLVECAAVEAADADRQQYRDCEWESGEADPDRDVGDVGDEGGPQPLACVRHRVRRRDDLKPAQLGE